MTVLDEPLEAWVEEALAVAARARVSGDRAALAERHAARFQMLVREQRSWLADMAQLLSEVEQSQSFAADGHRSQTGWCRALSRCSAAQAGRWRRLARLCAAFPQVHAALLDGWLGVEQADELARAYANPRVRAAFGEYVDALLADARRGSFDEFRSTVHQWARLVDEDGAKPAAEWAHRNRHARFDSDDEATRLTGSFGNTDGAEMAEILARYCEAEFHADCAAAKEQWGEDGYLGHLPRTARQRSADAMYRLFMDAARADPNAATADPLLNVTVDLATFEDLLADLAADIADAADADDELFDDLTSAFGDSAAHGGGGGDAGGTEHDDAPNDQASDVIDEPERADDERDPERVVDRSASGQATEDDPGEHEDRADDTAESASARCSDPPDANARDIRMSGGAGRASGPAPRARPRGRASPGRSTAIRRVSRSPDPRWWRCDANGVPVSRRAVIEAMLLGHVRRVVVDSAGVVVDAGRRRRLFTGVQREMVMRIARWCTSAGCTVPARHCQADHTLDHRFGGDTATSNGGPLCGHHNRLKNRGFTVWLDPDGVWHTYRPDGTEITAI